MTDFELLRSGRRRLHEFCSVHEASVDFFRSGGSYKLQEREKGELGPELRHITSTATCLESLLDYPGIDLSERISWFVKQALARPHPKWTSDGSAAIYCRCRALPLVIQYAPTVAFPVIRAHLERVFRQLNGGDRLGIGEAEAGKARDQWYPPNAFHTFWALEAVERSKRFGEAFTSLQRTLKFPERRNALLVWVWEVLGCQIALHEAKSAGRDTDQLLYALVIATRFSGPSVYSTSTIRYRDLIRKSLEVFFSQQDPTGTWVHHEPLFHYPKAGNAYCYIFESLTPLLKNALRPDAAWLRALLRPYAPKLFDLLAYADATKLPLREDRAVVGWSSGHRTNMPYAESWATAAVFGCMQALRRLIGIWTKEDALKELNHHTPLQTSKEALAKLVERGHSWSDPSTVAEQLITTFVNPLRLRPPVQIIDPDQRAIGETQARSAILFGPPGTSKTTLIQTLSAAVGWEYVELHPSHFVAGGLPNVQRTADEIFTKLMELDRCVVLFDEIDELMRERETEPDAFGRFLTTSMLPKLAELWKQRRILYFVATNHVGHFDQALTRSQRFDALILVPPPAFAAKMKRLVDILSRFDSTMAVDVRVTRAQVQKELDAIAKEQAGVKQELDDKHLLAKFVLLRWDQLEELAHILLLSVRNENRARLLLDGPMLKEALKQVADPRLKQYRPYMEFLTDRARCGRDFGKDVVWLVKGSKPTSRKVQSLLRNANGSSWCIGTRELIERAAETNVKFSRQGTVTFAEAGVSHSISRRSGRRP